LGVLHHWILKNSEIEADFDCISRTRGGMAKRMAAFDSAHQIGLSTSLEGVLIVVLGPSSLDFIKQRNRGQFPLYLHNQSRYGKPEGSVGFSASIGLTTYLENVLTVVGGLSSLD